MTIATTCNQSHLNSCFRFLSCSVKSVSSVWRVMTETPRSLRSAMKGSAALRAFVMWPLLPMMSTGRVVPLNLAIGTTLSLPSLICKRCACCFHKSGLHLQNASTEGGPIIRAHILPCLMPQWMPKTGLLCCDAAICASCIAY